MIGCGVNGHQDDVTNDVTMCEAGVTNTHAAKPMSMDVHECPRIRRTGMLVLFTGGYVTHVQARVW